MSKVGTHLNVVEKNVTQTGAADGETVKTKNDGKGYGVTYYDCGGAARTGVILEAGVENGQMIRVANISDAAESITFAAVGTSNVAGGVDVSIGQGEALLLVWNVSLAQWIPASLTAGGGGGLKSIQLAFALADMTDGGGAAATIDMNETLPLGAVVQRTTIEDITGFAGDTSAVMTVGDGTDVDRYNTGTPDVFTSIAAVDAGAVSGTAYHAAAKTPVITITAATEWGDVTAGAAKVTVYYY